MYEVLGVSGLLEMLFWLCLFVVIGMETWMLIDRAARIDSIRKRSGPIGIRLWLRIKLVNMLWDIGDWLEKKGKELSHEHKG